MKRRQNGFGTLVSKGEGKPYLARWCYDGKVYTKSTGEVDRQKALKALEKLTRPFREDSKIEVLRSLEAKVKSAEDLVKQTRSVKLDKLEEVYESSLYAKDISSGTLHIYLSYIRSLVDWLRDSTKCKEMKEVRAAEAKEYLSSIADKISTDNYNIRLVFFKKLWNVLKEEAGLEANVWEEFKKMKTQRGSSRRPFTQEELLKILIVAQRDQRMLLLVALGIYTGLRISDCAMLKWKDVDIASRVLRVVPIKTRRHLSAPIEIPIHSSLLRVLNAWASTVGTCSEYVCSDNAIDYRSGTLERKVRKLFTDCGIETSRVDEKGRRKLIAGFHSFRHSFISMAINSGMSPFAVQQVVGHASVDMTAAYFHSNLNVIKSGIESLPALDCLCA